MDSCPRGGDPLELPLGPPATEGREAPFVRGTLRTRATRPGAASPIQSEPRRNGTSVGARAKRASHARRRIGPAAAHQLPVDALGPIPTHWLAPARRRELLEILVARDCAVATECARQLIASRALLLDPRTIALRALGRVVVHLSVKRDYEELLRGSITQVADDQLRDSVERRDDGAPPPGSVALAGSLDRARAACASFNRLPDAARHALYRVAVLGESIAEAARALGDSTENVAARSRAALLTVLDSTDPEPFGAPHAS